MRAPGFEYAVRAWVNAACGFALRKVGFLTVTTKQSAQIADNIHLLRHVEQFVENNYRHPISLDAIAENCNFSKYYFAHCFKKITGLSFFNYLTAYRLQRAVENMKAKDASMTEIAYNCGFGSPRSFNRLFKKQFGITPTEYKNT